VWGGGGDMGWQGTWWGEQERGGAGGFEISTSVSFYPKNLPLFFGFYFLVLLLLQIIMQFTICSFISTSQCCWNPLPAFLLPHFLP